MTNLTTLKAIARKTTTRTLAIVDESGIIHDVLALNADIDTIITIEKYFDHSKLADDQYLIEIIENKGGRYFKMIGEDSESDWSNRIVC